MRLFLQLLIWPILCFPRRFSPRGLCPAPRTQTRRELLIPTRPGTAQAVGMAPAPSAQTWVPNIVQICSGKRPSPGTWAGEQSRGDLHPCWTESFPLAVQLCTGKGAWGNAQGEERHLLGHRERHWSTMKSLSEGV